MLISKMWLRQLITAFLLVALVAACIDRIELPIRSQENQLVVEGQITNEPPPYTVRLTYTGQYQPGGGTGDRLVSGAALVLTNDLNRQTTFRETSAGIYQTVDTSFKGQVGRAYRLTIILSDGKQYAMKAEQMPDVSPIDSIAGKLIRIENFATPFRFAYSVYSRDPKEQKNYYRWTAYGITTRRSTGRPCCTGCPFVCFDRCWTTVVNTDVNVYSDEAINGNSISDRTVLQLPIYAIGPQLVDVVQYGITQANYQFWKLYQQQSVRSGSTFDPLPAPITGNLTNIADPTDIARGYFAVASVTRRRYRNQGNEATGSAVYGFLSSQIVPMGDCRDTYGPVPVTEPDGW